MGSFSQLGACEISVKQIHINHGVVVYSHHHFWLFYLMLLKTVFKSTSNYELLPNSPEPAPISPSGPNRPKSNFHVFFFEKSSPHDLYTMTLERTVDTRWSGGK